MSQAMNADTIRTVEEIRGKRWYDRSTGLGAGGWPAVYAFAGDWKTYVLHLPGEDTFEFTAEDDEVAVTACRERFHLNDDCVLTERVVTMRDVSLA